MHPTADDDDRRQLFSELQSRYDVDLRRIDFGALEMEVARVANPDQALNEAVESEVGDSTNDPWEPYWAEAWDSANAIGAWLIENQRRPKRVIDLGCGLGVAGCVAASLGAEVVLGDNAPPSLMFARWNSWPWRSQVDVRLLDWNKDKLQANAFDLIVAADVLYARENWVAQESFIRYHLAPGGEVLFAEPNRGLSDEFPSLLEEKGWQVETFQYKPDCVEKPIRMFHSRRT